MTTQAAACVALAGFGVFFVLAFGLRTAVHWKRTGSSGYAGLTGRPGSAEWWGGALFAVALAGAFASPILQLANVVGAAHVLVTVPIQILACVLVLVGIAGTLWSQFAMGDSWRIGVDAGVRTEMVVRGPFRWVRNPIFTSMSVATIGLGLLVPNSVSLLAIVALAVALEIQVRLVEEPHLVRLHGDSYRRYAASVGRFVPGLGRREATR